VGKNNLTIPCHRALARLNSAASDHGGSDVDCPTAGFTTVLSADGTATTGVPMPEEGMADAPPIAECRPHRYVSAKNVSLDILRSQEVEVGGDGFEARSSQLHLLVSSAQQRRQPMRSPPPNSDGQTPTALPARARPGERGCVLVT
jgi:hypothetical protein